MAFFSLNKNHLTDSGFSSLKVFSVVFTYTDSTSQSTISDVSCPLQQVVQLLLIPGGIDSPCHGFRWQPLAGLLAFSEARPSTGRWGVGVSLFEARMHRWVPKLAIQKNGTWKSSGPNLFLICGCENWVEVLVKLGPSSPRNEWFELFKNMTSLAMKSPNWQWSDLNKLDVPLT